MRVLYIEPDSEWRALVSELITRAFPKARVACASHPRRARFQTKAMPDVVLVAGFTRDPSVDLSAVLHRVRTRVGSKRRVIVISSGRYTEEEVKSWGADHLVSRGAVGQRLPGLLRGAV